MNFAKDDDPHGVQKLLALLRTQQDRVGSVDDGRAAAAEEAQRGSAVPVRSSSSSFSVADGLSAPAEREDVRNISFAQALPHLTRLSKNEAFLAALLRLKDEQDRTEERLARERETFKTSKGNLSSSSALSSWDREALRRWDNMHHEHQKQLQAWGVPCFFETSEPSHLKKQARVFDVLYGLLD